MKYLKMLGLAAIAAMALTALAASSASATTVEITGVTTNGSVTVTASAGPEQPRQVFARTDGSLANECTESHLHWNTASPFSWTEIPGPVTNLAYGGCTRPITVHEPGNLSVEHIAGTTNGRLRSSGASFTVGSPFGTLNCKSGEGAELGNTTGVKHGHATIHIFSLLNCGFLVPSAVLKGDYIVTSPTGLGISA